MKKEGDRLCAARRRERPAQVHPLYHPAEVVAVAVVEPVDGVDAREAIKPGACLRPFQNHVWSMSKWDGPSTQTQTHHDPTSTQDEGWDGAVHGEFQERV